MSGYEELEDDVVQEQLPIDNEEPEAAPVAPAAEPGAEQVEKKKKKKKRKDLSGKGDKDKSEKKKKKKAKRMKTGKGDGEGGGGGGGDDDDDELPDDLEDEEEFSEGGEEEPEGEEGVQAAAGEGEEEYGVEGEEGAFGEPGLENITRGIDGEAPEEAEDADEVLFGRKRKRRGDDYKQMMVDVNDLIAKMEACAEEDMRFHGEGKPAVNKLKILTEVEAFIAQRRYHELFIQSGGLGVLKAWIDPYADGTLPNARVRACILNCCQILPIDTAREDIREVLKKSQLGSRVMFLAKCPEETAPNKKSALDLVQRWSRPIFFDPEVEARKRKQREDALREARAAAIESSRAKEEMDAAEKSKKAGIKYGQPGYRWHASIPQTLKLDYVVAPQSQSAVSQAASEMQAGGKKKEDNMSRKMREVLRKQKGSSARAAVPSVEGRNIVM